MANEHSQIVPSMQPTAKVADFKFWCQKVLPLVYDDSLSYYEVLNKMVVYLNQVIDNINADIDNVEELEDDFLLLQTYVNNFFDDIDQLVTYTERAEAAETAALSSAASAAESATNAASSAVNAATSSGSAATSALSAMDAKDAAVAAKTAAETALANAQTAATNAAASATAASNSATAASGSATSASGSATNAAASAASALQNFQLSDAARVAAQEAAEDAEAAAETFTTDTTLSVSGKAADAKVTGDEITELKTALNDYFAIDLELTPDLIDGTYINANNGSLVTNQSNFSMTAPIPVKKGQVVTLSAKGYNAVVGMIATCNEDNTTRQVVVSSSDSNYHDYKYTVAEDGYVVCSFVSYNATHTISLTIDYYDKSVKIDSLNIYEQGVVDVPISKQVNGYFVDNSGSVQSSENFFISQSIKLYKGQKITWSARGYSQNVAMISSYDSEEDLYSPLVISADSTSRDYEYTAKDNVEVIRCCALWYSSGSNVPYSAKVTTTSTTVGAVCEAIAGIEEDPLSVIHYPQIFTNIICMGDSITVGYRGSGSDLATHNYPFYFAKLTDAEVTVQANGSYTATQFWDAYKTNDYTAYDCAIIYLGTNGGLTDTVATDCFEDYTQNANTNTGNYGKIIGHIKETAPNCKIFLIAGVNDYIRRETTMNPAVRALADFYDVGLIDIENCILSDGGGGNTEQRLLYRPNDGIHYNTLGYMTVANMIYDSMNYYMSENRTMYASNY